MLVKRAIDLFMTKFVLVNTNQNTCCVNLSKMEFKTNKILLRAIDNSDLEHVFLGLSHPEVIKHYGVSFCTLEDTKVQMKWFEHTKQDWFAICSPDDKIFYGAVGLNDICQVHKKAEIGLWLLPEFWGRGFMQAAMTIISNYGFDCLGLHRIEGFVSSENDKCIRAMSKLDFELEGTMRDCEIKNNEYVSVSIFSKIKN